MTTYGYDPKTAELLTIDCSDATPGIRFTYDRLGRQETVTDAVGTRTFIYNSDTLDLNYVTIAQKASFSDSGLYSRTITQKYDSYGRSSGFYMGTDYDVTYGYEPATGRFGSLAHNVAGSQKTTTYYYVPKSDLIERVETKYIRLYLIELYAIYKFMRKLFRKTLQTEKKTENEPSDA
ncbi:MAG: hypothetical protein GY795_38650 [Desulfobacterales bacterium]|nr:hypothetical protein [Desulfobacterales bacterium]